MSGDSSEEKTLPPSDKKLSDARRKGQIARSKEMTSAAVTLVGFGYLFARAPALLASLRDGIMAVSESADQPFGTAVGHVASRLEQDAFWTVVPLVGTIVAAAVLCNIAVNGGVPAALDPIAPKMERLNPVEGFKRMFGMNGLVEIIKAVLKLAAVAGLAVVVIRSSLQALVELPSCGLACAGPVAAGLLKVLLVPILGLFIVVGGADVLLQRWLFRRNMRMTKTEQKRERKDMDGDPMIRRHHRQERRQGGAKSGLRNATFVIRSADVTLALRYAAPDALVPVLVARAAGEPALAMLEDARTGGLPIVFDAAATALVASRTKVGGLIAKDMFQAVIACMHQAKVL